MDVDRLQESLQLLVGHSVRQVEEETLHLSPCDLTITILVQDSAKDAYNNIEIFSIFLLYIFHHRFCLNVSVLFVQFIHHQEKLFKGDRNVCFILVSDINSNLAQSFEEEVIFQDFNNLSEGCNT